jgi:hypothetical protein
MQSFKELKTELTEYRDLGDRVLGFGRIHAWGPESGLELDSPTGWVGSALSETALCDSLMGQRHSRLTMQRLALLARKAAVPKGTSQR